MAKKKIIYKNFHYIPDIAAIDKLFDALQRDRINERVYLIAFAGYSTPDYFDDVDELLSLLCDSNSNVARECIRILDDVSPTHVYPQFTPFDDDVITHKLALFKGQVAQVLPHSQSGPSQPRTSQPSASRHSRDQMLLTLTETHAKEIRIYDPMT